MDFSSNKKSIEKYSENKRINFVTNIIVDVLICCIKTTIKRRMRLPQLLLLKVTSHTQHLLLFTV